MTASPLQNDSTRSLIFKLFTEAADEDYIVARVAFQFGLPNQFSWSAQQAIEKYLKGALLLNGISVKKSRHNIVNLFSEIRKLAPDLIPSLLFPPETLLELKTHFSRSFDSVEKFIIRLNKNGDTSQRYRMKGHLVLDMDLHHFDEVVFCFRRLNVTLSANFSRSGITFAELLRNLPNWQPEGSIKLPTLHGDNTQSEAAQCLEWRNFSFFPDQASNDGRLARKMFFQKSPISLITQYGGESSSSLEWVLDNVPVGKEDEKEIRNAIKNRTSQT